MLKSKELYLAQLLGALKVNPASPHAATHAAYVDVMLTMFADATVLPVGAPTPLTAPSGGGPVTGTGSIK